MRNNGPDHPSAITEYAASDGSFKYTSRIKVNHYLVGKDLFTKAVYLLFFVLSELINLKVDITKLCHYVSTMALAKGETVAVI